MQDFQAMTEKTYKAIARVFSGGKVTLPIEVRQCLGIEDGDYVELIVSRIEGMERDKV